MLRCSSALLLLLLSGFAACANSTCNGDTILCSKSYSNVTFLGAHNSAAVGTSISDNQHYDVTTQLNDGIRLLQGQGHNKTSDSGSNISICHSSCTLQNGGTLESYLAKVKSWVDAHPREVVTILWVNLDNMPITAWADAYKSTGLASVSYTPSSDQVSAWPTLDTLIGSGTTVVNFITSQADHGSVPYLLGEWSNIWETPYDNTDYTKFTCELDRGSSASPLYMANHFAYTSAKFLGATIDSPDTDHIDSTNSESSVLSHASLCAAQHSVYPNFLLVDYYEKASGGALQAVARMNGVSYSGAKLGTGSVNAVSAFFGGQNEIRNIIIVVAAGIGALVLLWIAICCCNKRKGRRNRRSMDEQLLQTYESTVAVPMVETPRVFEKMLSSHTKYSPLMEENVVKGSPYMNSRSRPSGQASMGTVTSAFDDIHGYSRPAPSKGLYTQTRYEPSRTRMYDVEDSWYPR